MTAASAKLRTEGYDYDDAEAAVRARGIKPHLRRRGEKPRKCKRGRPRRWVVERANSWHNNFRALRIRWETKATHYMTLVHMACALIAYRAATRRNGHQFLIVAVNVALAVGAPVVVAALLNGSEIVKVIDAVDTPQL